MDASLHPKNFLRYSNNNKLIILPCCVLILKHSTFIQKENKTDITVEYLKYRKVKKLFHKYFITLATCSVTII